MYHSLYFKLLPEMITSSTDKEISEGKSHTVITHLDEAGKLEMLARLISGAPNSSNT